MKLSHLILILAMAGIASAVNVISCQNLNVSGLYTVTTNFNSNVSLDCFDANVSNVTLDCQGHSINYNGTRAFFYANATNDTVKNCNVVSLQASSSTTLFAWFDTNSGGVPVSFNGTVLNNTASNFNEYCIFGQGTFNISGNTCTNGGKFDSDPNIQIESSNSTINNNTLIGSDIGILIDDFFFAGFGHDNITNNTIINTSGTYGVAMDVMAPYSFISGNTVNNASYGLFMEGDGTSTFNANHSSSINNTFNNITAIGISNVCPVSCFQTSPNKASSILNITGNSINGNGTNGFYLNKAINVTLQNSTINNFANGIYLLASINDTITGNNVSNNSVNQINLSGSSGTLIFNNIFNGPIPAFDNASNSWNTSEHPGPSIIGGADIGGNSYSNYIGTGNASGIGKPAYNITGGSSVDQLPLLLPPSVISVTLFYFNQSVYVNYTTSGSSITVADNGTYVISYFPTDTPPNVLLQSVALAIIILIALAIIKGLISLNIISIESLIGAIIVAIILLAIAIPTVNTLAIPTPNSNIIEMFNATGGVPHTLLGQVKTVTYVDSLKQLQTSNSTVAPIPAEYDLALTITLPTTGTLITNTTGNAPQPVYINGYQVGTISQPGNNTFSVPLGVLMNGLNNVTIS